MTIQRTSARIRHPENGFRSMFIGGGPIKSFLIAVCIVATSLVAATPLSAQFHFFVTPGIHFEGNDDSYPGAGGGALFDFADSWISAGVQADLFFTEGSVSWRGGPIGQFNFLRRHTLRPFAIGGIAWGENDGPMFGGGLEFRPQSRFGFRVTVQDYFSNVGGFSCSPYTQSFCDAGYNEGPNTTHQLSVHFGLSWR